MASYTSSPPRYVTFKRDDIDYYLVFNDETQEYDATKTKKNDPQLVNKYATFKKNLILDRLQNASTAPSMIYEDIKVIQRRPSNSVRTTHHHSIRGHSRQQGGKQNSYRNKKLSRKSIRRRR
jgi:uncharacterized membrane protein YvbJ